VTSRAPSGEQFEIAHGEQRATVVEVGGGVREYSVAGRPVLEPYAREAMCDGAHGAVLIPWPNRLADGRYHFDGVDHRLALSEPDRRNAIHGLLRWQSWRALEREPDRVVMGIGLHPTPGYPFALDVRIAYQLDDAGLTVATQATNVGEHACPYGAGQHPYLSPGDGSIDDCTLLVAAATRIVTDPERQIPSGSEPVAGTPFDFHAGKRLGDLRIDCAFTDLARDEDGRALARLSAPDGGSVELWVDESYTVLEIYTGDTLSPPRRRHGLAVEPMTCWPNAFQNGHGLVALEPGRSLSARWGVALR
jgi:aldose 1-epimerase